MMHEDQNTPEKLSANKVKTFMGALYFLISGLTSFMFFYENLPTLARIEILGTYAQQIGAIVSGLVGVAVFDGAAVGWLYLLLYGSDNNYQRSIAKVAFWAAIGGSTISSFAYLFLTGNSLFVLPDDFKFYMSVFSIFIIALAVVVNFVSKLSFDSNSDASRAAERLNVRRGRIQAAEEQMAVMLDRLIVDKTKAKLSAKADGMAEVRSDRLVDERQRAEMGDDYRPNGLPTSPPRRQLSTSVAANGYPAPKVSIRTRPGDNDRLYLVATRSTRGKWSFSADAVPLEEAKKELELISSFTQVETGYDAVMIVDADTYEPVPEAREKARRWRYSAENFR